MRGLTVYAHPDDESFGPAAVLAQLVQQGAELHGIWFTRGEHGQAVVDPPPTDLAALREDALREAAALIGYQHIELHDYEDGTLAHVNSADLERIILFRIRELVPDLVFTFGPAGITRHPDHIAVHRATLAAFDRARQEGVPVRALYYDAVPAEPARRFNLTDEPDGQPNTFIDVTSTQHIKRQALVIHARHVADARDRLERLEREPLPIETLHRAWRPVEPGTQLRMIDS